MRFGTKASEVKEKDKKFQLLQLGKSGAGKSTRTLTATQFGPVLLLDFDGKIQGALRKIPADIKDQVNEDNLYIENCRGMSYENLEKIIDELVAADKAGTLPFATIVIDTFTNFSDIVYGSIFKTEADLFRSNVMQLWGRVGYRTMAQVLKLQTLPSNLIVNCHVKEDENGLPIGPSGKGGSRDSLQPTMDDTQYLVFERGKYKVKLSNSVTPPVNTTLEAKYIDDKGYATEFGLKIFEHYAHRKPPIKDEKVLPE